MKTNNNKLILELALYAGEIMLKNGGETYRAEDVMKRICEVSGISKVESFVTPTGMFLSIDDGEESGLTYTYQKSIDNRGINLRKVSEVNDFARNYSPDRMSLASAFAKLESIDCAKYYSKPIKTIAAGAATSAFTLASGGKVNDVVCGFVIGCVMFFFVDIYSIIEKNSFIRTLFASVIGAVLAIICYTAGFCSDIQYILIGAIFMLLPGIAITNAIRDSLNGDLLSGIVRAFEALIIATSIAVGVGIIIDLYEMAGGVM